MLTPAAFLAALEDCLQRPIESGERLAVAVSGGADSLALLLLAAGALPGRVTALTVDHGLRAESWHEVREVARICAGMQVPHHGFEVDLQKGGNLQARAREARYAAMAGHCLSNGIDLLATAHHADDQAETLLMRMARGAGMVGMGGIRAARTLEGPLLLVRPLLGYRKQALVDHVLAAGLDPADDPSNRDDRYDRTRARRLLGENDWIDVEGLAATARHLQQESQVLDWVTVLAWQGRAEQSGGGWSVDAAGLPPALLHRLTLRALAELGCESPRGPDVERLVGRLSAGKSATLGGVQARPGRLWSFSRAAPHR